MNSTEEEKDNSKCLEKIISLFLNIFFFKTGFCLREGGGRVGYTQGHAGYHPHP